MFDKDLDIDELMDELLAKYPVFGSTLSDVKIKFSKKVPTAATDGKTIYINKEFLKSKPKDERVFIVAHEGCHIALKHISRAKGRDPIAWNYATDAIINEHLVKDGLKAPEGVIRKTDALNYDAEELYDEVYKAHQKNQQEKQQQAQNGQQGASGQQGQQGAENQQGGQGQANGQQDDSNPQGGQNSGGQQGGDNQQQTNQQTSGSGQQGKGGANWEDENGEKSDAESQQNKNQQKNGGQGSGDGQKHDAADEHPYSADDYNNEGMDDEQGQEQQQGGGSGAGGGKPSNNDLMDNSPNKGGADNYDGDLMPQDQKQQSDPYGGIFDSENEDMLGHDDHSMWTKVKEKKKDSKENEQDPDEEQQGFDSEKELFEKNDEMKREEAQEIMERMRSRSRGLDGATSEFALNGIGGKDKAVTDWRRLLKSYVEKEEERWGHKFSDSGNNWAARIEDYEIDERAESEIIIDTSGSVSENLVRAFLRQAKTILKDSDIKIGMFSNDFYGWQEIKKEEDIDDLRFQGGGGTNFDAASRAFSKKKTVNHICLTDGEDGGNAGIREKRSDIIWVCYGNPYFKPDNGKVIYVAPEDLIKTPVRKNQGRTY